MGGGGGNRAAYLQKIINQAASPQEYIRLLAASPFAQHRPAASILAASLEPESSFKENK